MQLRIVMTSTSAMHTNSLFILCTALDNLLHDLLKTCFHLLNMFQNERSMLQLRVRLIGQQIREVLQGCGKAGRWGSML